MKKHISRPVRWASAIGALTLLSASYATGAIALEAAPTPTAVSGCQPPAKTDSRVSNVKLTVEAPETLDPTKPLTFVLKGEGYYPDKEPGAANGVYVMVATTDVWKLGLCTQMTGDGDALQAMWIPASDIVDGKFTRTITVGADTLQPGKSYTVGATAAHGLALTERYFDRGITITIPKAPKVEGVEKPANVSTTVDSRLNIKVDWTYSQNIPGTKWRVTLHCIDQCTYDRDRASDLWLSSDRSYTFVDSDSGVYVAKVKANRWVNGVLTESEEAVSEPFAVGSAALAAPKESPSPTPAAPTVPAPDPVPAGNVSEAKLSWGLKESFRTYLAKEMVKGTIEVSDTLVHNPDGTFTWSNGTGNYVNGEGLIALPGNLHMTGHHGILDIDFAHVRLKISEGGTKGVLLVDGYSKDMQGGVYEFKNLEFATVDMSSLTHSDGVLSLKNAAATLTDAGAKAFGGFYDEPTKRTLDAMTFTAKVPQPVVSAVPTEAPTAEALPEATVTAVPTEAPTVEALPTAEVSTEASTPANAPTITAEPSASHAPVPSASATSAAPSASAVSPVPTGSAASTPTATATPDASASASPTVSASAHEVTPSATVSASSVSVPATAAAADDSTPPAGQPTFSASGTASNASPAAGMHSSSQGMTQLAVEQHMSDMGIPGADSTGTGNTTVNLDSTDASVKGGASAVTTGTGRAVLAHTGAAFTALLVTAGASVIAGGAALIYAHRRASSH